MKLGTTEIVDTFAEAFRMRYVRLIVTAHDEYWLDAAIREFSGYASSVIACDAEIGVERRLQGGETPDGRPGVAMLAFGFSADGLAKAIPKRTGQCLMTCPSTAVFNGLPEAEADEMIPLGKHLRYFGDGFQKSKKLDGRRYWRIPVMDGEFLVEEKLGVGKGVGGGNLILQSTTLEAGINAARRTAESLLDEPGLITPFPGGVARSGSKVGSRYPGLPASTSEAFCPTLRAYTTTQLHPAANFAYEVVIDGVDEQAVARGMARAVRAAASEGIVAIGAGNYGGKLGKFHFHLRKVVASGLESRLRAESEADWNS